MKMSKPVLVHFSEEVVQGLDCLVPDAFPNRNEAIRGGVRLLLKEYGLWNASVFTQSLHRRKKEVRSHE